jgi:hypothetical protein
MKGVTTLRGGAVLALINIVHADGTHLDLVRHFLMVNYINVD